MEQAKEKKKINIPDKNVNYKPKLMTMSDMQGSLRKAFKDQKPIQNRPLTQDKGSSFSVANPWQNPKTKPLYKPGNAFKIPISQPEIPTQEEQQTEEKPYWSAAQWEEWAFQIYDNYPDMRRYLPEWFIQATENDSASDDDQQST
jgi:hypothetical protein